MARTAEGLTAAMEQLRELQQKFWQRGYVGGRPDGLNMELEQAGRVADLIEFGELMCRDALMREESCGAHFREEYQEVGEAARNDAEFSHVTAWEYQKDGEAPREHREMLRFEAIHAGRRNYQ